jgi:hypothetical protein
VIKTLGRLTGKKGGSEARKGEGRSHEFAAKNAVAREPGAAAEERMLQLEREKVWLISDSWIY